MCRSVGHGSVDEGQIHGVAEWVQRLSEHIGQSGGLAQKACELGKNGGSAVGLVGHLPARHLAGEETQIGQRPQVAVQRPRTRLHHPGQFPNVQGTLRVKQQGAQDAGPRGPEQVFSEGLHVPDFASFEAISGTKMKD